MVHVIAACVPAAPTCNADSAAGGGAVVSSTSKMSVSQPSPLPAAVLPVLVSVTVFVPAASTAAGHCSTARRGRPLRSACRAIVESLFDGSEPASGGSPLRATVGGLPCCIELDTVRNAVPEYARSRLNVIVHVPGFVCA